MQNRCREIQQILERSMPATQYKVWVEPLHYEYKDSKICAYAPNAFMADFIRKRFFSLVLQAVQQVFGTDVMLAIQTASSTEHEIAVKPEEAGTPLGTGLLKEPAVESAPAGAESGLGQIATGSEQYAPRLPRPLPVRLVQHMLPVQAPVQSRPVHNWRFSFNDFVVGPCNELAHAASRALASTALVQADMLYLSSAPGLGKTHLMHAVGRELTKSSNKQSPKAAYLTAEDFASRFIHALKNRDLDAFKGFFRGLDILLLEDVHFLQGKEKTQIELLSTIKNLQDRGAKVVLTSSFAPTELKTFEEQLLSRFYAGFVSSIEHPDKATRKKIFHTKALQAQIVLPEEVEDFLADQITCDVRQIESCLNNLLLKAQLYNSGITMQMAWEVVNTYKTIRPLSSLDQITSMVCEVFGFTTQQLTSPLRKAEYVKARNIAFYLARKHTEHSLAAIGQRFRRRHSTVLKGITTLEREMSRETPQGRQIAHTIAMIERNGAGLSV